MDNLFSFYYKLVHTNLLEELRLKFRAGKIEDTFLDKKYHNLKRWMDFQHGADPDIVMYFIFERNSKMDDWESDLRSSNFKDYLKDKIIYESNLIIAQLLRLTNPITSKLKTEEFTSIQATITKYITDCDKVDSKYGSFMKEGLVNLQDRLSEFEPDIANTKKGLKSKLDPLDKNRLYGELSDLLNGLKSFGLVSDETKIGTFRSVFGFGENLDKVIWIGPKNALREFIILLEKENKIKPLGNEKASIIANLFQFKDDPEYDFRKLKSNNDPYSKGEDLKEIISYL